MGKNLNNAVIYNFWQNEFSLSVEVWRWSKNDFFFFFKQSSRPRKYNIDSSNFFIDRNLTYDFYLDFFSSWHMELLWHQNLIYWNLLLMLMQVKLLTVCFWLHIYWVFLSMLCYVSILWVTIIHSSQKWGLCWTKASKLAIFYV